MYGADGVAQADVGAVGEGVDEGGVPACRLDVSVLCGLLNVSIDSHRP